MNWMPATRLVWSRASLVTKLAATVSAFLTVGFRRREKPTVNHRTIDRGYLLAIRPSTPLSVSSFVCWPSRSSETPNPISPPAST